MSWQGVRCSWPIRTNRWQCSGFWSIIVIDCWGFCLNSWMTELMTINLWTRRASWSVRSNSCLKSLWIGLDRLATRRQLTQLLWLELDLTLSRWIDHLTPLWYFFFFLFFLNNGSSWGYFPPLTALSIDGRLSKPQPQEFHAFCTSGAYGGELGFAIESFVHILRTPQLGINGYNYSIRSKQILDITSPVGPWF